MTTRVQWMSREEGGSVLVSTMMLIFIMTLIGAGVFYAAVLDHRMANSDFNRDQSFFIASAGLNVGLRELADGDGTNDFANVFQGTFNNPKCPSPQLFCNQPFSGGSFTVEAYAVPNSSPKAITLRATGCVSAITTGSCPSTNQQSILQAVVQFDQSLAGSFVALNTLKVDQVDSFTSSDPKCSSGPTACGPLTPPTCCYNQTKCLQNPLGTPPEPICNLTVRANGQGQSKLQPSITITTSLYGSVLDSQGQVNMSSIVPGVGHGVFGNVTYDPNLGSCNPPSPSCDVSHQYVMGSIIPQSTSLITAPSVVYNKAPYCPPGPNISTQGFSTTTFVNNHVTPTNQYSYDQTTGIFNMQPSKVATMSGTGGPFCFGQLAIKGEIDITDKTTPVIIVVNGTINFQTPNALNNKTYDPEQVQLYSSCNNISKIDCGTSAGQATITFQAHAAGFLYLYAPGTSVSLASGSNFYGAILGYNVDSTGSSLHYDTALAKTGKLVGGIPTYSWQAQSWKKL
jgi:hypothetical protein